MSQIYKSSAAGPSPPSVPTQFTTNDGSIAIPVANNLNLLADDVSTNNENGIQTRAIAPNSDNLYVQLTNRFTGNVTTVGAVTSAISTFTPTTIGTYTVEARVSAYNTTSSIGAGYSMFAAIRFNGVSSTLCGTPDRIVNEEGTMNSANCTITVSGASILVNGVGYAAQTINWSSVGLYTFVGV